MPTAVLAVSPALGGVADEGSQGRAAWMLSENVAAGGA
jgi:hypothetical protein